MHVKPDGYDSHNQILGGHFSAVVQARDIGSVTLRLPFQVPLAMSGLPPGSATFTGRDDDLTRLLDHLAPDSGPPSVAVVDGMGGVGKTQLVIQAARTALGRDWLPGGVLFVDMLDYDPDPGRRVGVGPVLTGFLHAVGVPGEHIPADVPDRSRLYRSVLSAYAREGRRVLVVLDNVRTSEHVRPLLPGDATHPVIVTSRHRLADLDARLLSLDALPSAEAVRLLEKALAVRCPDDTRVAADPDNAQRLAELCAGLPLALRVVAAALAASPAKPLATMAADLARPDSRLAELTYADRTVLAAFDASYLRLPPSQARLFRLLSVHSGPHIATSAAAALDGRPEPDTRRDLDALHDAHLVDVGSHYGRWRMHDLIRLHSLHHGELNHADDDRAEAWHRLSNHYVTMTRAANNHLDHTGIVGSSLTDYVAANDWMTIEYPNLLAVVRTAAEDDPETARDLPLLMQRFMKRERRLDDWLMLSSLAWSAARRLDDLPCQAEALMSQGYALRRLRRFDEAVNKHEHALAAFTELDDLYGIGKALNSLGLVYRQTRRFTEAMDHHARARRAFLAAGDRHGEAVALDNYALVLRWIHRYDEAIASHEEALRIFRAGDDTSRTAETLDSLGLALRRSRRYAAAIESHQQAIALFRDLHDRHGAARATDNLGKVLRRVGRYADSVACHEEAVRIFQEMRDQHREGMASDHLGRTLTRLDRLEDAVAAHRRAVELFGATMDNHRERAAARHLDRARRAVAHPASAEPHPNR